MLLIGMFSLLREIQVQQVRQDLPVRQDQPDLLAEQDQRGPQVQQVLTVQMVQRQGSALPPLQQDLLA